MLREWSDFGGARLGASGAAAGDDDASRDGDVGLVLSAAGPLLLAIAGSALTPLPCAFSLAGVGPGIALACLAASMNATGLNLQRYAQRHGLRVLNAVGLALAVLCGVADMASFGFAPQSLLAPFGSLTLVINLLLAPVLHGDQIRTVDLSSTALVFAGVAICLANECMPMIFG